MGDTLLLDRGREDRGVSNVSAPAVLVVLDEADEELVGGSTIVMGTRRRFGWIDAFAAVVDDEGGDTSKGCV